MADINNKGLNRESFVRAWSSGDTGEQGGMLYDLILGDKQERKEMANDIAWIKGHLKYLWGGIAVLAVLGSPVVLVVLNNLGG